MSDTNTAETPIVTPENVATLTFNGNQYGTHIETVTPKVTKKNPAPKPYTVWQPTLSSVEQAAEFAKDLILAAETNKEGEGMALFTKLTKKQFEVATDVAQLPDGTIDFSKAHDQLLTARSKGKGLTTEELNEKMETIFEELALMDPLVDLPDSTPEEVAAKLEACVKAGFASIDELLHKSFQVREQVRQIAQIQAANKAAKADREAKRKAKEAAKPAEAAKA